MEKVTSDLTVKVHIGFTVWGFREFQHQTMRNEAYSAQLQMKIARDCEFDGSLENYFVFLCLLSFFYFVLQHILSGCWVLHNKM